MLPGLRCGIFITSHMSPLSARHLFIQVLEDATGISLLHYLIFHWKCDLYTLLKKKIPLFILESRRLTDQLYFNHLT